MYICIHLEYPTKLVYMPDYIIFIKYFQRAKNIIFQRNAFIQMTTKTSLQTRYRRLIYIVKKEQLVIIM